MLFRTHIVFSFAIYFLMIYFLEVPSPILFLVFVLLATVLVDVDSRNSWAGRWLLFRPFQFFVRHRGIFHSLSVALLISLFVASLNQWAGIGFFAGYFSHLFLDCFTRAGVRLFWPFSGMKIGFGIKSGGIVEDVIFVLLLLGNIFVVGKMVLGYLF